MYRICLLIISLVVLVACDRHHQASEPPKAKAARGTTERVGVERPVSEENGHSAVKVQFFPETPNSSDRIAVGVSGCRQSMHKDWFVNGELVGRDIAGLGPEYFERNDRLRVELQCGDQLYSQEVVIGNSPPQIEGIDFAEGSISSGQPLKLVAQISDRDNDDVGVSYRWFLNGEELLDVVGDTLPAEYVQAGRSLVVIATPNDGTENGPDFRSAPLLLPNGSPRIVSTPPTALAADGYRYVVAATDPDKDPLTFRLEEAPEGMIIDPQNGAIFWAEALELTGEFQVGILVEDPAGNQAKQEYSISLSYKEL